MSESQTHPPVHIVFGAYGGVGSALSRRLAGSSNLVLVGRDEEKLNALAGDLHAEARVADVADFERVQEIMEEVLETHGRVDGVVNAVGSILLRPSHLTRQDAFEETVRTNLTTAFAVTRAAAGIMSKNGGGSIVLFSTAAARIGLPNHEAIAAAKAGIDGLVRSAAATYGRQGVRVNSVAPGLVDTPLSSRITGSEKALENSRNMHTLGRIGAPDEVAALAAWLLGDDATWVTGQTLGIDGGLGTVRAG